MCRLYGMRATHPTKIGCDLLEAQNSLIHQSADDSRGTVSPDGWGVGLVGESRLQCTRDVDPAFRDREDIRKAATAWWPLTALAHVRMATVGEPALPNTHPFRWRKSLLAHNGHVPYFDAVRPLLLDAIGPEQRAAIQGETDSEHFFHLLLARRERHPDASMVETLKAAAQQVTEWAETAAAGRAADHLALNVLWSVGVELAGTRLQRTLYALERDEPEDCTVCGERHAEPPPGEPYRQVMVASERLNDEQWIEVPEATAFRIGREVRFTSEPLFD